MNSNCDGILSTELAKYLHVKIIINHFVLVISDERRGMNLPLREKKNMLHFMSFKVRIGEREREEERKRERKEKLSYYILSHLFNKRPTFK